MQRSLEKFQPQLVFYVGGATPFFEDKLGGVSLSIDGLGRRGRLVFQQAGRRGISVATTLAARDVA